MFRALALRVQCQQGGQTLQSPLIVTSLEKKDNVNIRLCLKVIPQKKKVIKRFF